MSRSCRAGSQLELRNWPRFPFGDIFKVAKSMGLYAYETMREESFDYVVELINVTFKLLYWKLAQNS